MRRALTSRQRKALEALRSECDYEDHHKGGTDNYVHPGALPVGIGAKTLADLVALGLVETGSNRWIDGRGYRITTAGREAI